MYIAPYLGQHQCLSFAALITKVTFGLECVLDEGILPENYKGVFLDTARLCNNIVDGAYCLNFSDDAFEASTWFSSVLKEHPMIYQEISTYEDLDDIAEILVELTKDHVLSKAYSSEKIKNLISFFWVLCGAVEYECIVEGIDTDFNVLLFPESSSLFH